MLVAACLISTTGLRLLAGHEPAGFSEPEVGGTGHHAIGDIYDEERTIVLAGEVESFLFGNPHSLLHVRIVDDGGRARTWAVEWRAANRLSRAGLTGDALSPGDAVTLCGHPGRDPAAYRLYLLNVARSASGFTCHRPRPVRRSASASRVRRSPTSRPARRGNARPGSRHA